MPPPFKFCWLSFLNALIIALCLKGTNPCITWPMLFTAPLRSSPPPLSRPAPLRSCFPLLSLCSASTFPPCVLCPSPPSGLAPLRWRFASASLCIPRFPLCLSRFLRFFSTRFLSRLLSSPPPASLPLLLRLSSCVIFLVLVCGFIFFFAVRCAGEGRSVGLLLPCSVGFGAYPYSVAL